MKKASLVLGVALCLLLTSPARGGDVPAPEPPGPEARCPVCGMFVAPFAEWTAAVVFAGGEVAYFDGPKDLFRFYHNVGRYDRDRRREDITALFVTEYYSATLAPAQLLLFVIGSDVAGPMGAELVPVKGEEAAQTFSSDHRGTAILRFEGVTPKVLANLQ